MLGSPTDQSTSKTVDRYECRDWGSSVDFGRGNACAFVVSVVERVAVEESAVPGPVPEPVAIAIVFVDPDDVAAAVDDDPDILFAIAWCRGISSSSSSSNPAACNVLSIHPFCSSLPNSCCPPPPVGPRTGEGGGCPNPPSSSPPSPYPPCSSSPPRDIICIWYCI